MAGLGWCWAWGKGPASQWLVGRQEVKIAAGDEEKNKGPSHGEPTKEDESGCLDMLRSFFFGTFTYGFELASLWLR